MDWIRARDMTNVYPIGKTYAHELLRRFRQDANPRDWIKDGNVLLVKKEAFEDWWKQKSQA